MKYNLKDKIDFLEMSYTLREAFEGFYWERYRGANDAIFDFLGIDKKEFSEKVIGYKSSVGGFPIMKTLEDVEKLTDALLLECAKFRYPVGTKFKCLVTKKIDEIPKDAHFRIGTHKHEAKDVYSVTNGFTFYCHFKDNKWAEVIEEPKTKTKKEEFIVGQWYKLPKTSNFLAKYKSLGACSEYISDRGDYSGIGGSCNYDEAIACSLEEIQPYLPKGHPDLIVKGFVLPERWHVVVTEENQEILSRWKYKASTPLLKIGFIVGIATSNGRPDHNPGHIKKGDSYDFGEEITTEQFKKYVLKEEKKSINVMRPFPTDKPYWKLRCIKETTNWYDSHPSKVEEKKKFFPGDITWCAFEEGETWKGNSKTAITPENNKNTTNYRQSDFEILETVNPTKLTINDLIVGECYTSDGTYGPYVFQFRSIKNSHYINLTHMIMSKPGNNGGQYAMNTGLNDAHWDNLRRATSEEIKWLNVCMTKGTFVEKDYALRGYDMYGKALKENIPEEKSDSEEKFKAGDILYFLNDKKQFAAPTGSIAKCVTPFDGKYINIDWIDNKGTNQSSGKYYPKNFRKALLHEIPSEELKVGDWIVVTKQYADNYAHEGYIGKLLAIAGTIGFRVDHPEMKGHGDSFCSEVRKARPEEVQTAYIKELHKEMNYSARTRRRIGNIIPEWMVGDSYEQPTLKTILSIDDDELPMARPREEVKVTKQLTID